MMTNMEAPSAGAQINALQNRLVMAQSDLAVLTEQRERKLDEVAALRNALSGVRLGQQQAAEQAVDADKAQISPNP
jgi:predicted nuclease with TOPRIM domain